MNLRKRARFLYQPVLRLGKNRIVVTDSKAHWDPANEAAVEGGVLLQNGGPQHPHLPKQIGRF